MAVEKINIDEFLQLAKHHPLLDVRSPSEFNHAQIPGSINLPLFTDEERRIVGTTYKQESRQAAIKVGLGFFGPKMSSMIETVEKLISGVGFRGSDETSNPTDTRHLTSDSRLPTILLYCWRGGMRSAGVAWLLDLYGFKVYTLSGGYKNFRRYVLDTFLFPFNLNVLGGFTGSGKTELLKELRRKGQIVVDLEEIAKHKGSAFGNIGMPQQPTQEMFENILAIELQASSHKLQANDQCPMTNDKRIWVEDESQRIGNVNIPNGFWNTMRQSPVSFIEIPFEARLQHLVEEYGNLDKEKLIGSIERIRERLGGLEAKNSINYLIENNISGCFGILLKYYDKWYLKALHNREGLDSLLTRIPCEKVNPLNARKLLPEPAYENP